MFFLEKTFQFPPQLAAAIAQTVWKSPHPSPSEIDRVGRRLRLLWPMLAKERGQVENNHYSFSPDASEAYAAYYLTANAMKWPLLLQEMQLLGLTLANNSSWLDLGAGPGTTMAGLAWWCHQTKLPLRLHQLEQSKFFVDLGERLQQNLSAAFSPSNLIANSWTKGDATDLTAVLRERKPQIISLSNSLSEIAPNASSRDQIFASMLNTLHEGAQHRDSPHWLLIIEPGSQFASRDLLQMRAKIAADPRCQIWLPCLNNRTCGALADPKDWCHEEASCEFPDWHTAMGQLAGLQKQSLIFSYLVVSVGVHPQVAWNRHSKRMVSQRLEQKGQTQCYLCTSDQGKQKVRVQHSKANDGNRYFLKARRGEIFSHVLAADKGDVIDFSLLPMENQIGAELEKIFPSCP
jgi:hypothetical protein